jgi:hypothetical protein
MTVANSIKAQLEEAAHILRQQTARIAELEAEVERLKANASAHQTLASIYTDPAQPTGHRIRAATAALACETPRLESVPPAIDATCEEIYEPLSVVVERQRKRANEILALPLEERERMIAGVVKRDGNGDDSGSNDHS